MTDQPLADRLTSCGMTVRQKFILDMAASSAMDSVSLGKEDYMRIVIATADYVLSHPVFQVSE